MVSEIESWPPVYPYGNGAVYNASSWHRGPTLTVVLLALPSPWIISKATTGSPVRRYGRLIATAMEETTFATATH